MPEAFFDESSSTAGGRPVLIIAGFVSPKERWRQFDQMWREGVLEPFKISHFHTKQLRSQNASLYRHLTYEERRALLKSVVETIAAHVESAFSIYMRPHDWQEATSADEMRRWGTCYGVCIELLLGAMSDNGYGGSDPRRVSIFMEDGHQHIGDALKRITYYQQDTEPPEWPSMIEEVNTGYVEPMRMTAMRIDEIGAVSKLSSYPAQAADFLAYLVGYVFSGHRSPVFESVFDHLLSLRPVVSTGWSPANVKQLTAAMREVERMRKDQRTSLWNMKSELRNRGTKAYELPWGLVIDKFQEKDELRNDCGFRSTRFWHGSKDDSRTIV
jgi:hypothetical protein